MKQKVLILLVIFTISACAAPQEIIQSTKSSVPLTVTPAPTQTPEPSPTPTLTPEPYLLEDGVLLDWDEEAGDYQVIAEGIDALTSMAEGEILALDGDGFPRFVFQDGAWEEIQIPKGAENHEELNVQDRYVTLVTEDGKTEEILESGIKVLVNPETGKYEYEFKNGALWVEYTPRVMVIGEHANSLGLIEVPKDVIESAAETVQSAEMFKRVIDGEEVELETGMDEKWGVATGAETGATYVQWYGVLCGAVETSRNVFGFLGVEMKTGDIMLINMIFYLHDSDESAFSLIIDGEIMPNNSEADLESMMDVGRSVNKEQISKAITNSPVGTPFYISMNISKNTNDVEGRKILDAFKNGEFYGSEGEAAFKSLFIGASNEFWDLAESQ